MIVRSHDKVNETQHAIDEMYQAVQQASRYLIKSDMCIIHRESFIAMLNVLNGGLPEAYRQAQRIVAEESQYREQTKQECDAELAKARTAAQQMIADAQKQLQEATAEAQRMKAAAEMEAQQLRARAEQEAAGTIRQAQEGARQIQQEASANASRIVAEAEQQKRELVSKEQVLQEARQAAENLNKQTRQEMNELHDRVYDFLGGVMLEIDRHLVETIQSVRTEYQQLQNHRQMGMNSGSDGNPKQPHPFG